MKRSLRAAILLVAAVYSAICFYMFWNQRSFLYKPAPAYEAPEAHGLPQAQRLDLRAGDGLPLVGWWLPPQRDDAPVYLYFHGNANGLARRASRFGYLARDGSGVLAMSYRGYGGSGGSPSEAALHADALLIYRHLAQRVSAQRIVIFGESLGSGVALNLARQVPSRGVILDSPYLSVLRRAQASYPWLPVSLLLIDSFRSDRWIGAVDVPILIIHGSEDRVIPPSDSAELAALGSADRVTRKLYDGQPHVVPLDKGPMPDILDFVRSR